MIELTEEQRRELDAADVPRVVDPRTRKTYILVAEDVYERLQALLVPDRIPIPEQRALLHSAGLRAGWDDPAMDIYGSSAESVGDKTDQNRKKGDLQGKALVSNGG